MSAKQKPKRTREVKFCPCCGRRPEVGVDYRREHISTVYCEKCDERFTIWQVEGRGKSHED